MDTGASGFEDHQDEFERLLGTQPGAPRGLPKRRPYISFRDAFDWTGLDEDEWYHEVLGDRRRDPPGEAGRNAANSGLENESLDVTRLGTNHVQAAKLPETSKTRQADSEFGQESSTWSRYLWELVTHVTSAETVRGKQSRLTVWEVLEHFDFFNDLLFIYRVATLTQQDHRALENAQLQKIGIISVLYRFVCGAAVLYLTCIWIVSVAAYASRCSIIYHRVLPENSRIFYPFIVFAHIRRLGETSPETLYMFHRLSWTYQLVVRFFEDIPQLLVSAFFLASFGQSLHTFFMIAYSCMLMIITSVRMGLQYPLFGTLSLVLSRTPPVDSPVLSEASPTTRNFSLFVSMLRSGVTGMFDYFHADFALWAVTNALCLFVVRGWLFFVFLGLSVVSAVFSALFSIYWVYLTRQDAKVGSAKLLETARTELAQR